MTNLLVKSRAWPCRRQVGVRELTSPCHWLFLFNRHFHSDRRAQLRQR